MPKAAAISRRGFLTGRERTKVGPLPPGVNAATLMTCSGCGACVEACPEGIIALHGETVALDFAAGGCTFCNACADACPEAVFAAAPAMAHVAEIGGDCLAIAGVACMTCRDACPEQAIAFRPRIGGPFLPALDAATCTGCGACVAPCPAQAIGTRAREPALA